MIVRYRVQCWNLTVMLLIQLRKNAPKQVVFNIRDLTRTTDQVLTTKTRQNAQNSLFSAPKIGCFCVAGLLSKRRI
ncbi:hypothetical protein FORC81_p301 (plasmid) [Escherichia coli]|nr:hypothetical protein FORC81_p301 [Escherichia coli]